MRTGSYRPLDAPGTVLAYQRDVDGRRVAVALNMSGAPATVELGRAGHVAVSTRHERDGAPVAGSVDLAPGEGVIVEF